MLSKFQLMNLIQLPIISSSTINWTLSLSNQVNLEPADDQVHFHFVTNTKYTNQNNVDCPKEASLTPNQEVTLCNKNQIIPSFQTQLFFNMLWNLFFWTLKSNKHNFLSFSRSIKESTLHNPWDLYGKLATL